MADLKYYKSLIEEVIQDHKFPPSPENLYDPLTYFLGLGGKRIRPILVLMGHHLFDDDVRKALGPSLAVEFFHNFSLIHDDIMDNAPLRRGKPTVHEKWNQNIGILSGDILFVHAYQELIKTNSKYKPEMLSLFNKTAIEVCEGQQMDMDFENQQNVTLDSYLEMIRLKTAVLVGCALELGALSANADPLEAKKLYDFGQFLGVSFQLKDDFLDVYADEDMFGKQVGGDIISGKKTVLLIKAFECAGNEQRKKLMEASEILDPGKKVSAVVELYDELKVAEETNKIINLYYDKAIESLDKINLPESKKRPLYELASYLLNREN